MSATQALRTSLASGKLATMEEDAPSETAPIERVAQCCCGHLSIGVVGEPVLSSVCHCDDCRRRTGSAFGWSAYFPKEAVSRKKGKARTYAPASGTGIRHFCGKCGSTLYWEASGLAELVGIAGGAFVEAPLPRPAASYRDSRRCEWVDLPEDWERKL